jgi:hypothetical protein
MSEFNINSSIELCVMISSSSEDFFDRNHIARLLTTDADINFQDANRNFNTPLHLAIIRRNIELIELLLSFQPSLKLRNINGFRPKDLAMNLNFFEVVEMLDEYRKKSRNLSPLQLPIPSYSYNNHHHFQHENDHEYNHHDSHPEIQSDLISKRSDKSYASTRVHFLLSVSKIDPHFKKTHFNLETLRDIYSQLDENDSLRPLMKVVKEMPWIKIFFIFHQTQSDSFKCTTDSLNEKILISGFKNGSAFAAEFSHKLLHHVLNLVNDNESKPYRRKQTEKMIRFRKIVTIYKNRIEELHPIVRNIFNLPDSQWDAELIACVPFLLSFYTNEQAQLYEITLSHKDLFDFYHDVVLKDIDDFLVRSNLRKFRERPIEGSSFGRRGSDPYKIEKMEEKYGNSRRYNKRHNAGLERVCSIS